MHPHPLRVLILEDHLDTLQTLARLLQRDGYEVREARTVFQGEQIADEWEFDVLLCDIGLSDGDGWSCMKRLRQKRDFCAFAMSGYCSQSDIRRSYEAGFQRHFAKPFDPEYLRDVLRTIATKDYLTTLLKNPTP